MGAGALRTPMAAALLALVLVSTDPSVAAFVVVGGGTKLQRLHCLQHLPHLLQMHTCASFMSITITSMIALPRRRAALQRLRRLSRPRFRLIPRWIRPPIDANDSSSK